MLGAAARASTFATVCHVQADGGRSPRATALVDVRSGCQAGNDSYTAEWADSVWKVRNTVGVRLRARLDRSWPARTALLVVSVLLSRKPGAEPRFSPPWSVVPPGCVHVVRLMDAEGVPVTYSAVVRRLLISCPGDVPREDLSIVQRSINRWNGIYGEHFGAAVIPISWGTHAAAQFGRPAQAILNEQLVDTCDGCLAIFANRMGTPTASAESGTAEEIDRLNKRNKYVAVLRSRRPVQPASIDNAQKAALDEYMEKINKISLVLEYSNDAELSQHVDAILTAAVAQDRGRTEGQLQAATAGSEPLAQVWPRVVSEELPSTGSGSRRAKHWFLALHNTGQAPALNVSFKLRGFRRGGEWILPEEAGEGVINTLAPDSETRFPIVAYAEMAPQAECVVTWTDNRGREQVNSATLRIW